MLRQNAAVLATHDRLFAMRFSLSPSVGAPFELWPQAVAKSAGIDRLCDLRDSQIRELPGIDIPQTEQQREYFFSAVRDAFRKRERLWLAPMTDAEIARCEALLPIEQLGPKQLVDGREITPMGLAPRKLIERVLESGDQTGLAFLRKVLDGQDSLLVSAKHAKKLSNHGIKLIPRSRIIRLLTNFKFWAYAIVLVYSALRVLPVTFVKQFEGSLWALWAIDLGTAIPYTWGILTMFTAKKLLMRLAGMLITIATFIAPYVYFAINGKGYPPIVIVVIVLLIASTFALEGSKVWLDRRVYRNLATPSPAAG